MRKKWVDFSRGVAMLAIILFHTEIYFTGNTIIDYNLYVENFLMFFFTISGYLFFKDEAFDIRKKIISIFRFLIIPYFIFSCLIAIPKTFLHGETIMIEDMILNILLGKASWFVAALAIAEIIFSLLLYFSQKIWTAILPIGCIIFTVFSFFINSYILSFWYTNVALLSLIFLYLGYFYHKKENLLSKYINFYFFIFALIIVIGLKIIEQINDLNMVVYPSEITSPIIFIIDCFLSTLIFIYLFKRFNKISFVNYIGRNSIVFYFLCGGVPFIVGLILNKIGLIYNGNYSLVLLAFAFNVTIISVLNFLITKYFPFLLGKTKQEIIKSTYPKY